MTDACERVHALVDGELAPEEARRVRLHLATCAVCQAELERVLQMKALADEPAAERPAQRDPRRARPRWALRTRWTGLAVLGTAIAAGALFFLRPLANAPRADLLWLAEASTRPLELRLSYTGADRHRPYDTLRAAGPGTQEPVPLGEMAQLERTKDWQGLAAAYLLRKELGPASAYLARAGSSPDVEVDRATLDLLRGDVSAALERLEGVLARAPRHPQARWNRGLALERLGLAATAAEELEAVAALGERGWSDEARQRAQGLRTRLARERQSWEAALAAGPALITGTKMPTPEEVAQHPGLYRLHFHDALRAAPSVERVKALWPLAEALDAQAGGSLMRDAVRRAEARDFRRRAPLAEAYAKLVRKEPLPGGVPAYLDQLRRAGEDDLLLGALLLAKDVANHLQEYRALATATKDPWFLLLAEHEHAKALETRGELLQAEQRLLAGVRLCAAQPVAYRCALLERELATLYRRLHRPSEAARHASAAWDWARRDGAWGLNRNILLEQGRIARFQERRALSRAWLDEAIAREPEDCSLRQLVLSNSAASHVLELAMDEARRDIDEALRCPGPLLTSGLQVLADLARQRPAAGDAQRFTAGVAAMRSPGKLLPGELVLLTSIEGRFTMEQDRAAGEALLRRAIEDAARLPSWDTDARKGRAYSYSTLLMAAGKAGEYERAFALLGEELEGPLPGRCVLGAAVDDERTLLLARGPDGKLQGSYTSDRKAPLAEGDRLVPEPMLAPLRGCAQVAVVARPPLHGRVGLLPPELAWSYVLPRAERVAASPGPERRLVVAGTQPPPELGLAPLAPWTSGAPGDTLLQGAMATPDRVLAAMARATEVEIHAHGLVNLEASDASLLLLSPEADGRYALTAADVRARRLQGAPLVILAACRAAHTAPVHHEPFSLPVAFLSAGARAVLAATVDIPDAQAGPFFDAVRARIHAGQPAAQALRDERMAWLPRGGADWVRAVLVFE